VTYRFEPRVPEDGADPKTGDVVLETEPRKVKVLYYQGTKLLAAVNKNCSGPDIQILAWALELRARIPLRVPIRPEHVTVVRLVFPATRPAATRVRQRPSERRPGVSPRAGHRGAIPRL
jgi:hypothetical protein